jgi:hypothetical protein
MAHERQRTPVQRNRKGEDDENLTRKRGKAHPGSQQTGVNAALREPQFSDWDQAPTALRDRAVEKYPWIRRYTDTPAQMRKRGLLMESARAYAAYRNIPESEIPPYTTLRTWAERYDLYGMVGLVDRVRSDAGTIRTMTDEQHLIMQVAMLGGKLGASAVLALLVKHSPAGQSVPSYPVLWNAMKAYQQEHADLIAMAREGELYWRDRFDLALSHGVLPGGLCLSVDSTVADRWVRIFDLSEHVWMAVRPVLTVIEDVGSRSLIAFNLSLLPVDSGIITGTFFRAINAEAQADVHPGLPSVGIPYEIRLDKGSEHQAHFRHVLDQLQIHVRGTHDNPKGQAHVERVIGTITTELFASSLGGSSNTAVFDPYLPRTGDSKRSLKKLPWNQARVEVPVSSLQTLEELEEEILSWATVYNQRPHPGLEANLEQLARMLTVADTLGVPMGVKNEYRLHAA